MLNPELQDPEEALQQEQEAIDTAEPLSEEQVKEKEVLLEEVGIVVHLGSEVVWWDVIRSGCGQRWVCLSVIRGGCGCCVIRGGVVGV